MNRINKVFFIVALAAIMVITDVGVGLFVTGLPPIIRFIIAMSGVFAFLGAYHEVTVIIDRQHAADDRVEPNSGETNVENN